MKLVMRALYVILVLLMFIWIAIILDIHDVTYHFIRIIDKFTNILTR